MDVPKSEIDCNRLVGLLDDIGRLAPKQRQRVAAELATRLWLQTLERTAPVYPDFEKYLWLELFNMDHLVRDHLKPSMNAPEILAHVTGMYYHYLRSMFGQSGKTRKSFYNDMLVELGLAEGLGVVDFGPPAMAFMKKVSGSVHREHLLVCYLVELARKLHTVRHARGLPMSDEEARRFYEYFEGEMPLSAAALCDPSAGPGDAKASIKMPALQLPLRSSGSRRPDFKDKHDMLGCFETSLDYRMTKYERTAARKEAVVKVPSFPPPYPYMTISQSSGWGKSELVAALRTRAGIALIDICLREEGAQGEPARTKLIASKVEDCTSPLDFLQIIHGCLASLKAQLPTYPTRNLTMASFLDGLPEPFWRSASEVARCHKRDGVDFDALADKCRGLVEKLRSYGFTRIIFSLDEAASLFKSAGNGKVKFQNLLDALAVFPYGVFGVLLDTTGRAYGFVPPGLSDLVEGRRGEEGYWLPLSPFIFLPTTGALMPEGMGM